MFAQRVGSCWIVALAVMLTIPPLLQAQTSADEPPSADQPADFSQVVGTYRISEFTAQPTEVVVEDPVTVTVHITGKGPKKYEPRRGPLHLFKEAVLRDFYIEPVADEDRFIAGKNGENTWVFVYRLRPRTTHVKEVPEPQLVFYRPRAGYQTSYPTEDPIPLKVNPRRVFEPETDFIQAPDRFYHLARGDRVLAQDMPQSYWHGGLLIAVGLGTPALSWLGLLLWQRLFPDDGRRLQRLRNQAARRAVRQLESTVPGSVILISGILTAYLRQRLDFPACEPTPEEVARFLRRRGFAAELSRQWGQLFGSFDQVRFTPADSDLAGKEDLCLRNGIHLIQALEADPCLASHR